MDRDFRRLYDNRVIVKYIDVDDDEMDEYPEVDKLVKDNQTPLPIVAIDKEPLWAGYIFYPYIVTELNNRGIKPTAK